jgi:hypothetical protein
MHRNSPGVLKSWLHVCGLTAFIDDRRSPTDALVAASGDRHTPHLERPTEIPRDRAIVAARCRVERRRSAGLSGR